jgi:hypothetical protein
MTRALQAELLDELPAHDPAAQRSRRDLRRINSWMGNVGAMARPLRQILAGHENATILELGAGDAGLMAGLAARLGGRANVTLLDRQRVVAGDTLERLRASGWTPHVVEAEALAWLATVPADAFDVVVANLFLHHFADGQLDRLFGLLAKCCRAVVACEPARSRWALSGVALLPLLGCNHVTRHDARVSVRAGFRSRELSAHWPVREGWELNEQRAGIFGHRFVARRIR